MEVKTVFRERKIGWRWPPTSGAQKKMGVRLEGQK
jgi:hypothetical protein